jgi:hypothetical protein
MIKLSRYVVTPNDMRYLSCLLLKRFTVTGALYYAVGAMMLFNFYYLVMPRVALPADVIRPAILAYIVIWLKIPAYVPLTIALVGLTGLFTLSITSPLMDHSLNSILSMYLAKWIYACLMAGAVKAMVESIWVRK